MSQEGPDYYPYNLLRYAQQTSERHEALKQVYERHLAEWDEVLPTRYLAECAHEATRLLLDAGSRDAGMGILQIMEEGLAHDDPMIVNEVGAGFVEGLPDHNDPGANEMYAVLPPQIRHSYDEWFGPRART